MLGLASMQVWQDLYFSTVDLKCRAAGDPAKSRFFLDYETGQRDAKRFGRRKAAPAAVYIRSSAYKARYKTNTGNWQIVVNGGEKKLRNRMGQAKRHTGQDATLFFFTTLEQFALSSNTFTDPIWYQTDSPDPKALLAWN